MKSTRNTQKISERVKELRETMLQAVNKVVD